METANVRVGQVSSLIPISRSFRGGSRLETHPRWVSDVSAWTRARRCCRLRILPIHGEANWMGPPGAVAVRGPVSARLGRLLAAP